MDSIHGPCDANDQTIALENCVYVTMPSTRLGVDLCVELRRCPEPAQVGLTRSLARLSHLDVLNDDSRS